MTTALDTKLATKALALINKIGTNMVFEVPTSSYYDPLQQKQVTQTPSNVTRKASPPLAYSSRLTQGRTVRRDDAQIFLAQSGLTFTPVEEMKVTHAGLTWHIVQADPLYSGDDIAAWDIQLRR